MATITERPAASPVTCSIHDWRTLRYHLLFVFDSAIPAGEVSGPQERHSEYSGWLIRNGEAWVECDGQTAHAVAGQWLFCFGTRIVQRLSPDIHLLSVRVAHSWPDDSPLFQNAQSLLAVNASDHPGLERAASALIDDVGRINWFGTHPAFIFQWQTHLDFHAYLRHHVHLLQWTDQVFSILDQKGWRLHVPRGVDARLAIALNVIDTLPFDAALSVRALAQGSGLSIGQLNRMCRKAYGHTLYDYWDHRRLHHARLLLGQPDDSIKGIAAALGFKQLSHFSIWFKRYTGQSPRQYRHARAYPRDRNRL